MYISDVAYYLPETVISNDYFEGLNGLTDSWIVERTGIKERRRAAEGENSHTMAVEAVKVLQKTVDLSKTDLIVAGSYTPYDTVSTIAHQIQHHLDIEDVPAVYISAACSSFANAVELAEGYFAMNKATDALIVLVEHNTAYNNDTNTKSGHLWGDGAAAIRITKEKISEDSVEVIQVKTGGAATVGRGINGVVLRPFDGGLTMPNGRDVFINACNYMAKTTIDILEKNNLSMKDLDYLITHQANLRIAKNVVENLQLPLEKTLNNIEYLGNTGCAGSGIVLAENWNKFKKGDNIVVTVFGGGYSYGTMLLKK
ncbi:MAG: ketoacyl-ACP synthase III [Cyclobacteriaceae bacterium]